MTSTDSLFCVNAHEKLIKAVHQFFQDFLQDMIEDLDDGYENPTLSQDFLPDLKILLHSELKKDYNPYHITWASLIEQVITIAQLHEELEECDDPTEKELIEGDIFDFWNNHEYSSTFIELTEDGKPVATCSETLVGLLENQVLSFHAVHLNEEYASDIPVLYSLTKELADGSDRFHIHGGDHIVKMDTTQYAALIPISRISHKLGHVEIQDDKDVYLKTFSSLSDDNIINLEGFSLKILTKDIQTDARLKEFNAQIVKALDLIKKYSPNCFTTFKSFSHTIVPISDEGIVSYSLQSMPGVSCINMFHRDFIDLVDDLIHENGHHYLNYYLNHQELINEDDEQIFFSPWREALRPIRGLYHGVFTFYWAFKVFSDLSHSIDKIDLEEAQKQKILLRYVEEYKMLEFCRPQIQNAYKLKKINEMGMNLISVIYQNIESDQSYAHVLNKITTDYPSLINEISTLDKKLEGWKTEYKLF
jgi:hypothetical protein